MTQALQHLTDEVVHGQLGRPRIDKKNLATAGFFLWLVFVNRSRFMTPLPLFSRHPTVSNGQG